MAPSTANLADIGSGYDMLVGLSLWSALGNKIRLEVGNSREEISNSSEHDFIMSDATYANDNFRLWMANQANLFGSGQAGFASDATAWAPMFSTGDKDNDITTTSECAKNHSHAWWDTNCWNGSFWGDGKAVIPWSAKPYWVGSTAPSNWGAIWVKWE